MTAKVPTISLESWKALSRDTGRVCTRLVLGRQGEPDTVNAVVLERCASGRLREAYPVSEHDIEIRVTEVPPVVLTSLLGELVAAILAADPHCRRVIYAAPEGDLALLGAAEEAGFRYVVDVDLPDGPVSLAAAEPAWVTSVDMDLERVPHT